MDNFIGKDNFVWWVGIVEDTNDPLKIGRVRVRIFGWHTDDTTEIPTESLPWAQPISPLNTTRSFATPLEKEYVFGFFGDGVSGQMPIMIGTFTNSVPAPDQNNGDITIQIAPKPTIDVKPIQTDLPPGQISGGPGQPTTPPTARGVVANTGIAYTNSQLVHVCDFRYQIDLGLGVGFFINPITAIKQAIQNGKNKAAMAIRMLLGMLTDKLRAALKTLIAAANLDPSGKFSYYFTIAKDAIRKVNEITKKIAEYAELASFYYYLVKNVKMIIDYLKSLPATVLALIQECIAGFLGGVLKTIGQIKDIAASVLSGASTLQGMTGDVEKDNATIISLNALEITTQTTMEILSTTIETSNTSNDIITIFNTTDANTYNLLVNYIHENFPNSEIMRAQTAASLPNPTILKASP